MATVRLGGFRFGKLYNTVRTVAARNVSGYSKEIGYPIPGKEPKWTSAEEALSILKSDMFIFAHGAAATPHVLMTAMTQKGKADGLKNITVSHMHTEGPAEWVNKEYEDIFHDISFFMGGNIRKAVNEGRADMIPIFLHEIPITFHRGLYKPDIVLLHVSPPDRHGFCTLGTSCDCSRAAATYAKYIIAQVNPNMPRTFGDTHIHVSHFDYAVCVDYKLPEHGGKAITPLEAKIGKIIGENLIEDGATLQMGIGAIPDAVLAALINHKGLGIHSEMFASGVVDLMEKGCITNEMKKHHRGRTVGSFINGTQRLYDWVDDNPSVEMLRVDYVNATRVIRTMPKMTAINSALEVDITGQVNADSIGTRMYSGFGGQVDFIRGAGESYDGKGKPIIALPSTTAKGLSKIVPMLKPGAGVVSTRAHVQYIVTEYGIASLWGQPLKKRAYQMIQIAHPDHREALEKAAFERFHAMPAP